MKFTFEKHVISNKIIPKFVDIHYFKREKISFLEISCSYFSMIYIGNHKTPYVTMGFTFGKK